MIPGLGGPIIPGPVSAPIMRPLFMVATSPAPAVTAAAQDTVASAPLVQVTNTVAEPKPDAWKKRWQSQIIYFPLTDRFKDGDPSNNYEVNRSNPVGFHGGDLRGMIDSLDYLKDLGVSTIWVPPVAENTNFANIGGWQGYGYHGYWIKDHYAVEEHQGTLDTVKELVTKAHARDMKVVLDIVLNHVGPDHPWRNDPAKEGWFHKHGAIKDWENVYERENGDVGGLPDLAQENEDVYQYLLKNTLWWIQETGVDGIRLDAVKHIPVAYWQRFAADIKAKMGPEFMLLGEVLHGDPNIQAPYQRAGIDALFDLPLYYTMREVFGQDMSAERLGQRLDEDAKYDDPGKLVTLLDNHDLPRFMSSLSGAPAKDRLKLALAFLMTVRGIPSVYYGTEVGLEGGNDPDNRRMMEFGKDPELTAHFKKLTGIRNANPALQFGTQLEMWRDPQVYAFARRFEGQEIVAVFNNAHEAQTRDMPLRGSSPLRNGAELVDALTGETFRVEGGRVNVSTPAKSARILVPKRM